MLLIMAPQLPSTRSDNLNFGGSMHDSGTETYEHPAHGPRVTEGCARRNPSSPRTVSVTKHAQGFRLESVKLEVVADLRYGRQREVVGPTGTGHDDAGQEWRAILWQHRVHERWRSCLMASTGRQGIRSSIRWDKGTIQQVSDFLPSIRRMPCIPFSIHPGGTLPRFSWH